MIFSFDRSPIYSCTDHIASLFEPRAHVDARDDEAAPITSMWNRFFSKPLGLPARSNVPDQAGDLGATVAAGAPKIGQHHAAIAFAQSGIGQTLEHTADVLIALLVTFSRRTCEFDLLGCVQKL